MKQFIEETKERYLKLKESEKELEAQERIYEDKTLSLSVEFDKAYTTSESLKRMFFRRIAGESVKGSVVVGLVPVTGVTLPFLSYGGSSLIITMMSIGIILNISRNN